MNIFFSPGRGDITPEGSPKTFGTESDRHCQRLICTVAHELHINERQIHVWPMNDARHGVSILEVMEFKYTSLDALAESEIELN